MVSAIDFRGFGDHCTSVAKSWGADVQTARGGASGFEAGVYTWGGGKPIEFCAPAAIPKHALAYGLKDFRSVKWSDGRRIAERVVRKGEVLFFAAGTKPAAVNWPGACLHILIPPSALSAVERQADHPLAEGALERFELVDPAFEPLALLLARELQDLEPRSRLFIDSLEAAFAAALFRSLGGRRPAPFRGGLTNRALGRVLSYLEAELPNEVRLGDLARVAGLSPAHFATAFRRSTGLPPHRWLMKRRIERAQEMLRGTDRSITEVACSCGFASSAHFATAFKNSLGVTPSRWRRESP